MTPDLSPCSTCKGFCCGSLYHDEWGSPPLRFGHVRPATHTCPDCDDGTYEICGDPEPAPKPVRTAEEERADVLAFLERAATYPNPTAPFSRYVEMLVELIRDGEHVGAAKKASDGV